MYLREVGKLALYVRKKEWLMRLGSLGYIRRFHFWEFASEAGGPLWGQLEADAHSLFGTLMCGGVKAVLCPLQLTIKHELMPTRRTRLFN